MDLALELGMTVAGLKASMTTTELGMWAAYARKKFLPARRIELYLAQVAQVHAGGRLTDFLLDHPEPTQPQDIGVTASALSAMGTGKVHRIKRGA